MPAQDVGQAKPAMASQRPLGTLRSTPRQRKKSKSNTAPPVIVQARNHSGLSSRRENFIIGQLTPHMSVRATNSKRSRPVGRQLPFTPSGQGQVLQTATGALMAGWCW